MCDKVEALASLGTGYPMYYSFHSQVIWALFFLLICVSIPCMIVAAVQINKD